MLYLPAALKFWSNKPYTYTYLCENRDVNKGPSHHILTKGLKITPAIVLAMTERTLWVAEQTAQTIIIYWMIARVSHSIYRITVTSW